VIYVDKVRHYPNTKLPYKYWSHMWADSVIELHVMADKIGLKRSWLQDKDGTFPHYDVVPSMRALAIKHGAIPREITLEDFKR